MGGRFYRIPDFNGVCVVGLVHTQLLLCTICGKTLKNYDSEPDFVVDSRETGHWQGFQPTRPESRHHKGFHRVAVIPAS